MLYSKLRLGEEVSKFTLGTVQLGLDYGMANAVGKPSEEQAFGILDAAFEAGVNSLDTAVAYGTSEEVIGHYLKAKGPRFYVTSKFSVRGSEDPAAAFHEKQEKTLTRIGGVKMYFFHDAVEVDAYGDVLRPHLEKMKADGYADYIGTSVYDEKDVEEFIHKEWLDAIQVPMNMLDRRIIDSGCLEELEKQGRPVFVRSVFLQGMLCMEKVPDDYSFMQPYIDELHDIAKAESMTLPQMAMVYIRDLPGVTSLVLGCDTADQVRNNAEMLNSRPISKAGQDAIRALGLRVPIEKCMSIVKVGGGRRYVGVKK